MRLLSALLGLATLPLSLIHGNPIAVDSQRRQAAMTAEDVMVIVGQTSSTVSGRFSFRQKADNWPEVPDTHVLVYIPVLLSQQGADQYEKRFGAPVVIAEGRRFSSTVRNDLAFEDSPNAVLLPNGWYMQMYEVKIPLGLLSKTFQIDVHYVQPNFPGGIAGYVPSRPPKDSAMSRVIFRPIEGHALRPVGPLSGFAPPRNQLTFTPQDRKLIRARLVRK